MHNAVIVQYLCEQPDVTTSREHGFGFILHGQAVQHKASRGEARQDKPLRCVGQAKWERSPLVLKNTECRYVSAMQSEQEVTEFESSIAELSSRLP